MNKKSIFRDVTAVTLSAVTILSAGFTTAAAAGSVTVPAEPSRYSIIGAMTGWVEDLPMYETEPGIYVGETDILSAGYYEFKVRADEDWAENYGAYEWEYDRTYNSQTNVCVEIDEPSYILVKFDTTGDDDCIWPISYAVVAENSSKYEWIYTGKEEIEPPEPAEPASRYGIVGSMTDWGTYHDFPMYETDLYVYVGMTNLLAAGEYEFKVRADESWDEAYGVYEYEYDRTYNSMTNLSVTLTEPSYIAVMLDTTGDDQLLWPVSYAVVKNPYDEYNWVYTGKNESYGEYGDFEYYVANNNEIWIIDYSGNGGTVVIPDTIDGKKVTSVEDYAFRKCRNDISIVLPAGIRRISPSSVFSCPCLKNITVDENNPLYSSKDGVLFNKDKTKIIICPAGKEGKYVIPDGVRYIGACAFYDCFYLTDIEIPESVDTIDETAFCSCTSLKSIIIPAGVKEIQGDTFAYCSSLENVVLPESLEYIYQEAFDSNPGFTIYGEEGSYAHYYALNNNITFRGGVVKNEIDFGETIAVNAKILSGRGNYTYAVLYKKKTDAKWYVKQNYSRNPLVFITPLKADDYDICVKVKDVRGNIEKKYFSVVVNMPKLINQSYISAEEIKFGDTVALYASATGGTGKYTYAVLYKKKTDAKWTVKQNYSTVNVIGIKPLKQTEYDICVKVKDTSGKIDKKYFTVDVTDGKLKNTSTISATLINKGDGFTLNGAAAGGAGGYMYAVQYKKMSDKNWTTKQNFGYNDEIEIYPYTATDYEVCIKVRDKEGTVEKKYFTVAVQK